MTEELKSQLDYFKDEPKYLRKVIDELEQENKDLKKQIESDKGLITVGGKQQYKYLQRIDELEQENERLKDELNKTIKEYNYFNKACVEANTKNIELQRENEELKEETLQWKQIKDMASNNKYKSALEEIREIADKCKECLNEDDDCGCDYLRIKRKIDEVLE